MRADWINAKRFKPKEAGTYLVTTAKRSITLDHWDGERWGKCTPHSFSKHPRKGVYKPHIAWTFLPPPATEDYKNTGKD